jgi:hypothetical protein
MFKHAFIIVSLLLFTSLSARVLVFNKTDEDLDAYAGSYGWKQVGGAISAPSYHVGQADKTWGVGGVIIQTKTQQQFGPFYVDPSKKEWSYNDITATVTKDKGVIQVKVEPK